MSKMGRCLWCEASNVRLFADDLCDMCTNVSHAGVTAEMEIAWIEYEPPSGFAVEQGCGYNEVVVFIRHAFMSGYRAASVDTHAERCDVEQAQPARVGSAVFE